MNKKVLVVDDELDFVRIVSKNIEQAGYEVESASNGKEAVGAYIASLYRKRPISLILLDIRLPDINGIEVLEIIRNEERTKGIRLTDAVRIILLTAYDDPKIDPSKIKGCNEYMLKSSSIDEMLKRIKEKIK